MVAMSFVQKNPKSGVYRVRRLIPVDARMAFEGRKVFLKSLGTRDAQEAKRLALPVGSADSPPSPKLTIEDSANVCASLYQSGDLSSQI